MSNKITLEDIFNDDDFGLLNSKAKSSSVKSADDRLIDSFEEINAFIDKNNREPTASSMSEYSLLARLKTFRQDEDKKKVLKPFDRHNLLGHVELESLSLDDVLSDDDFGLLDSDKDLSIFKLKNIPTAEDRAETESVSQRKSMSEIDFVPYEAMFQKVHREIKEGKRKILPFHSAEKNLHVGNFYIIDGVLLYLEDVIFERQESNLSKETSRRKDGRTLTIFENGTYSDMLYRSLSKQIQKNGKLITSPKYGTESELFVDENLIQEEDFQTGWIYVLKSKSTNPQILSIKDLYKIGFSSHPIDERIKNAKDEATYLYADVIKVATYKFFNRNADKLELLLHRFFASACLNVDLYDERERRFSPREWFVVPFEVIEEAINLILNESIVNYMYDVESQRIKLK
ncbi:MAG: GIY-YIG nuclease family protein [Bacteroidales bacterium]|nr:GIY-YIG nuclease family protein [Bacteroidales bacterium]